MLNSSRPSIQIDLNEFKLHLHLKNKTQLTLHFNSPSRSFYLSVIALVVNEMKKMRKIRAIPLQEHLDLLILLNESIGGAAGSSEKENLLSRIYRKWKDALPNLEEAPLFRVLGRKKEEGEGTIGKIYSFTDVEKDEWANLFEYMGSHENVRLKFAIDKIDVGLDETSIVFGDYLNGDAWDQFIASLKKEEKKKEESAMVDKPSIAVLPFVNMSDDPKQEFFSDGMTEEIITALSKSPELFVIARTSTFVYKGKAVKVKQVSEELGVRYVLEGSIRREKNRVRITAQFIDAVTGYHLWGERYDREMKEVFALQDEIALKIMTALDVKLQREHARLMGRGVKNLEAYLKAMEGRERLRKRTKEDNALAHKLAEEAITTDPDYARGYALLAFSNVMDIWVGATKSPKESLERAIALIKKAIALDPSDGYSRSYLAYLYAITRQWDKGFPEVEQALALDPNSPETLNNSGMFFFFSSKMEEAIPLFEQAIRLDPFAEATQFRNLSAAYCETHRYEEGIAMAKAGVKRDPKSMWSYLQLTAVLSAAGRDDEARAAAAQVLKINPNFSLEQHAGLVVFKEKVHYDHYIDALRKAGLK